MWCCAGGVDGIGVVELEQMIAVLLDAKIVVRVDGELVALLVFETGGGVVLG